MRALRATAEQRKVHPQHGQAGQRRRNHDRESHDREHVNGAVDKELLTDEAERSRKAGTCEPMARKLIASTGMRSYPP